MTSEQLQVLRMRLKSGEYDGAHIMQAWIAIDELIEARKENEKLKELLRDIKADLLDRSDTDSDGVDVVNLSHSI